MAATAKLRFFSLFPLKMEMLYKEVNPVVLSPPCSGDTAGLSVLSKASSSGGSRCLSWLWWN